MADPRKTFVFIAMEFFRYRTHSQAAALVLTMRFSFKSCWQSVAGSAQRAPDLRLRANRLSRPCRNKGSAHRVMAMQGVRIGNWFRQILPEERRKLRHESKRPSDDDAFQRLARYADVLAAGFACDLRPRR